MSTHNALTSPPLPVDRGRHRAPSLRNWFALLLVCVLAALWAAVDWDNRKSEQNAKAQMRQQTAALAMAFADHTEATLQRGDHILLQLRQDWLGDTAFQISVIAADGTLAFSNLAISSERVDWSDSEYFKVHRDGGQLDRLFVSRLVKGRVSGKWALCRRGQHCARYR